jgi:hypothetical protein
VRALFFYVIEGQQRCFIEEVPGETLIRGTYKNPDFFPFGTPEFNGVVSGWPCVEALLINTSIVWVCRECA